MLTAVGSLCVERCKWTPSNFGCPWSECTNASHLVVRARLLKVAMLPDGDIN